MSPRRLETSTETATHLQHRRLTRSILLEAVDELVSRDRDLRVAVERFGPPPLWARKPGYATLVRIILEQQVSLASAQASFTRLQKAVTKVTPERVRALSLTEIRTLGITRQKAEYCWGLARTICDGELNLSQVSRADESVARETLVRVRGIGSWSADMYLLMALCRPNVWPDGDIALAESARRLKRLRTRPSFERLRRIANAWEPWRAVAARILWHTYLAERQAR